MATIISCYNEPRVLRKSALIYFAYEKNKDCATAQAYQRVKFGGEGPRQCIINLSSFHARNLILTISVQPTKLN